MARRVASEIKDTGVEALKPRLSRFRRRRRGRLEMLRDSLDARKDTALHGASHVRNRAGRAVGNIPFLGSKNGSSNAANHLADENVKREEGDISPETTTEDR